MIILETLRNLKNYTAELRTLPTGSLVIHKGKYGGHQFIDPITKKRKETYIPLAQLASWQEKFKRRGVLRKLIQKCRQLLKGKIKQVRAAQKQLEAEKQQEAEKQAAWKKAQLRPYKQDYKHYTLGGEFVRTKSEVILADYFYLQGIPYEYEKPLQLGDTIYYPDFTLWVHNEPMYIEHLGKLEDPEYRRKWEYKKEKYAKYGIYEGVNLICTREYKGCLNVREIHEIMRTQSIVK